MEGSTASTATVKRDKSAVGTVHIIIMASASLLGLVFAACLILKLVKYRRAQNLRNLEKRTTRVLHHPYTVPFHNPAYTFPGTGPVPAMELLQVVPPIQNVFYNRDSVATLANQPHFNPPLPPIENSFYRPSDLVALGSPGETISMPNLAWTPDRHRTARRRTPGLKRSTNPSLQVAGLQARATTPSWQRGHFLGV
ncbi:PREDICTED: uncharacterized protein LOC109464576 [Branchiostoma belcheri]|uniref:Uncharacterized protein LOC109464576 n=1 Tax=Branchiostoma belcheri TaxID=7741 RepID=A0A6P4XKQ4_BRABE|nr:PREDICTED: uncharacterized protein LOC109464576 [Branchiostoma belcheri]